LRCGAGGVGIGSVLKHPLARGVLNCSWSCCNPRLSNCARTQSPLLRPCDIYVQCACHADPEGPQKNIDLSDAISPAVGNHPSSPQGSDLGNIERSSGSDLGNIERSSGSDLGNIERS